VLATNSAGQHHHLADQLPAVFAFAVAKWKTRHLRILRYRCSAVRRVCPLHADAPVNGCFIGSTSLALVKH
jgi:hypothetical protein